MKTALTQADIERGYEHDEWGGYGYLGERGRASQTAAGRAKIEEADARLLAFANHERWSEADLFDWCNSKLGRWFGEGYFFSGNTAEQLDRDAKALLRKVDAA